MKTLKFSDELAELMLQGKKGATWRINDDNNLSKGDVLSCLRYSNKKEFAQAEITSVKETTFGELTNDDWEGHERFASEKDMYETYSKYYNKEVTNLTPLKIIKLKLT